MSLSILTALLSAYMTLANPLPKPDNYISACERATNCELFTRPDGRTGTRFVPGMEPGSADYASRMAKRALEGRDDEYPKTSFTIGDHKIAWGCNIDPVKELGHLDQACHESGQCDNSDPYEINVGYLNVIDNVYAGPVDTPLNIVATGNYPNWFRNGAVQAIQAAASGQDIIEWHRGIHWNTFKKRETPHIAQPNGPGNVHPSSGECDVAVLSSHIGLNVFSHPDTMMATMEATITLPKIDEQKTGFCAVKPGLDFGAAIAGGVGGWGAGIAGILGSVSAMCS